tara:strand:+ start:21703 stop:22890 length:1188 start_codon:yes stop_codon:yes gene_type:complete
MRTSNIAKGSTFNIKIDLEKSKGSYIFDKNSNRYFLDFFGMYASLPLGYNSPALTSEEFKKEIIRCSHTKVTNCEFISSETEEFDIEFSDYCGKGIYSNFHYCSTGALAVEAAIKTSLHYKKYHTPNILSFKNSFHGVNSYGGFVTDRFFSSNKRLKGLPEMFSTKCGYDLEEVKYHLSNKEKPVTCVLVEPIQCTAGDIHHSHEFFHTLRMLCNEHDVPLIFDEIQIGFGATGTLWFFEHLDIIPDIVIFGKKTQVSGFMAIDKFSEIFNYENVPRLEVTWNSNTLDMIRSKYIVRAYKELKVLNNVRERGYQISENLSKSKDIYDLRSRGLIIGFDLKDTGSRDRLITSLYNKGMICNSTGHRSIRLRPNLCITSEDTSLACELIKEALAEAR